MFDCVHIIFLKQNFFLFGIIKVGTLKGKGYRVCINPMIDTKPMTFNIWATLFNQSITRRIKYQSINQSIDYQLVDQVKSNQGTYCKYHNKVYWDTNFPPLSLSNVSIWLRTITIFDYYLLLYLYNINLFLLVHLIWLKFVSVFLSSLLIIIIRNKIK